MFKAGYRKAHHSNITKDENMNQQTIDAINTLGNFCGKRDIEELTSSTLTEKYNIPQADIFVLFGGSIICGGDVLAQAIQNKIAKHYIIVGGAGHTTQTLREKVHTEYPSITTEGLTESEIFNQYLKENYGLDADYLENKSTNRRNNITYLLDLVTSSPTCRGGPSQPRQVWFSFDSTTVLSISELSPCVPRLCYIVLRSCIYQPHSLISDIYRRIYISVMMGPALRTIPLS